MKKSTIRTMARPRAAVVAACLILAMTSILPGCGNPEGTGSIDVETSRGMLLAQGGPDPLAPKTSAQVPPKPTKKANGRAATRRR